MKAAFYLLAFCIIWVAGQTGNNYLDSTRTSGRVVFFTNGGTFGSVPSELCAPDDDGNCDEAGYAESIVLIGFLPMFIGFAICCFCPCFWACRICCWGGYSATEGWWYPGEPKSYSVLETYVFRGIAIFGGILSIILFIIAIIGNGIISTAQNDSVSGIVDVARDLIDDLNTVNQTYADLMVDQRLMVSTQETLGAGLEALESILGNLEDGEEISQEISDARETVGIIALVFAVIPAVIFCIGGMLQNHWCAWCPALYMWFTLLLLWVAFGLHYPFSALVGDTCVGINEAFSEGNTNEATALVLECENSDALDAVVDLNWDLISQVQQETCELLNFVCNQTAADLDPNFNTTASGEPSPLLGQCAPDFNLAACLSSVEETQRFVNTSAILDTLLGCPTNLDPLEFMGTCPYNEVDNGPCMFEGNETPELICENRTGGFLYTPTRICVTECREAFARMVSDGLVYGADASVSLNNLHIEVLIPTANCVAIRQYWEDNRGVVCGDLGDGLAALIVGIGGQAIGGIFLMVAAIMATKRFNVDNLEETELTW